MDCCDQFQVEIGDIQDILTAEGQLISTDDYLPNITASLQIYPPEYSTCTEIIFERRVICSDDDLVFFRAAEDSQKGVVRQPQDLLFIDAIKRLDMDLCGGGKNGYLFRGKEAAIDSFILSEYAGKI